MTCFRAGYKLLSNINDDRFSWRQHKAYQGFKNFEATSICMKHYQCDGPQRYSRKIVDINGGCWWHNNQFHQSSLVPWTVCGDDRVQKMIIWKWSFQSIWENNQPCYTIVSIDYLPNSKATNQIWHYLLGYTFIAMISKSGDIILIGFVTWIRN